MHPDEITAAPAAAPDAPDAPIAPSAEADAPLAAQPDAPTPGSEAAAAESEPTQSAPGLSPAECGARLAELFPALFVAPGAPGPFKPIKLRIHADIVARAPGVFSKRVLGIFFSRYTTSGAYLKALVAPEAQRFDLDGLPAGGIAEEHRAAALEELARRHAIAAERRAAQRRPMAPPPVVAAPDGAAPSDAPPPRAPSRRERDETRPQRGAPPHRPPPRPRPDGRDHPRRDGPDRAQRPSPRHDAPTRPRPDAGSAAPAATALPTDAASRERALLLRAFEASPLSKANFCVLKRIGEAELDALLSQARAERA